MPLKDKDKRIEEIFEHLSNGDVSYLDELYELIKTDIYAYAISKVKNKFDVDDIIQDTIITIYKNCKLYTSKGKPMAWIITIENNIINKTFNDKNKFLELNEEVLTNSIIEDTKQYVEDEFLNKLLSNLKEDEREVISLHIVSDMKFREIAEILNKPIATILSKYNRAIKKIQNITKEENL